MQDSTIVVMSNEGEMDGCPLSQVPESAADCRDQCSSYRRIRYIAPRAKWNLNIVAVVQMKAKWIAGPSPRTRRVRRAKRAEKKALEMVFVS